VTDILSERRFTWLACHVTVAGFIARLANSDTYSYTSFWEMWKLDNSHASVQTRKLYKHICICHHFLLDDEAKCVFCVFGETKKTTYQEIVVNCYFCKG